MSIPSVSKKRHQTLKTHFVTRASRVTAFFIIIALIALVLFSASFASSYYGRHDARNNSPSAPSSSRTSKAVRNERSDSRHVDKLTKESDPFASALFAPFLPQTLPGPDSIVTYDSTCTTATSSFSLGDTVCVKVSGGSVPRRLDLSGSAGLLRDFVDTTDVDLGLTLPITTVTTPQTILFKLPSTATSVVNGQTVDNRGVWRVNSIAPFRFSLRSSAFFTVSDPQNIAANLVVYNSNNTNGSTTPGSNISFVVWITNTGPDAATNVTLTDIQEANATFVSKGQDSGPTFDCSGGPCTK